ncbi:MAG TPA: sugar ABC transporter permease [Microbacterium sp.]|uniref:carbohydrate ABC transporter permease n=1 Tax=Microbacterium sp. TaxID=51671 RepID=UPI002C347D54|nr:sugar ABC transporter permease [Microbacterium sp.]HWI31994.1 sugar ABC transporter permease [Microbacterium sp.]
MAAPAVILLVAFLVAPFIVSIVLSFFRVQLNSPRPARFVGFEQYARLFTDPDISADFFRALGNNFLFVLAVVPAQTVLALALAILLNRKLAGIAFFRTVYFMPLVFPFVLVAVVWRLIFARDERGLLNDFLATISGGQIAAHDWLGSSATALGAIVVMSIWQSVAFQMIIFLGALQAVPRELYEAAELDRASAWQRLMNVTVPGIRNTLIFVALLTTIFAFRLFDQVYVLNSSGSINIESTQTMMFQLVNYATRLNNVGQAAAMSVVFLIIVATVALIQRRLVRQEGTI